MTALSLDDFNPKKAELIALADKYRGMTIKDESDKEGYNAVHEAQMELQSTKVDIEKRGKEMREDAIAFQKAVIALQKSLTAPIIEVEEELKAEKARINQLKLDIKLKAEREAREITDKRIRELAQYNVNIPLFELEHMGEAEFVTLVETSRVAYEAQQAEIAQAIIDRQRLDQERAEFEAEKRKMDIEKQAILDEQNKAKREAELAAAREQSRLQAIADTEVRIAREKLVKDQAEQAEKKKLEAGRKFKAWLTTNGVTEDNKSEYKVITENNTSTLYKIISTYQS
jgi:hypothetical protein